MRFEYIKGELRRRDLAQDPFVQFERWFDEAQSLADANVMALATVSAFNEPSCRMVLLKKWDQNGFLFFTDYRSLKGQDLASHSEACATLFWNEFERQICIRGKVEKTTAEESDEYFATRPRGSQLSVWTSIQDEPISSRSVLENKYKLIEKQFAEKEIPRPSFWGGFRLIPHYIEFWQGRKNRLHDRFAYQQHETTWKITRLSP